MPVINCTEGFTTWWDLEPDPNEYLSFHRRRRYIESEATDPIFYYEDDFLDLLDSPARANAGFAYLTGKQPTSYDPEYADTSTIGDDRVAWSYFHHTDSRDKEIER